MSKLDLKKDDIAEAIRKNLDGFTPSLEPVSYTHLTLPTSDLV